MRIGSKSMFGLGIFMVLFVALPVAAQEIREDFAARIARRAA